MSKHRRIPIRAYACGLFIALTLAIGCSMAGLFYTRMRSAIIATSNQLFDRTASIVAGGIAAERSQIALSLEFAAGSELARARTFTGRRAAIGVLHDTIAGNPWLVSAYAGYPDGDFLLLRRVPAQHPGLGVVPAGTAFMLQTIDRSTNALHGRYAFFDARMHSLGERDEPGYRYDPRSRPWFAARGENVYTTAPYLFFTTKQLGITMSRRSAAGSVFGADIDLASVSAQLAGLRPTASSMAALVESDGTVLAYSDPSVFARVARRAKDDRAPALAELRSAPLSAAFTASTATGLTAGGTYRDAEGRSWLYRVAPILGRQGSSSLVVASILGVPEDELLDSAIRARNEVLTFSLALVLLWIPVTVWLSHFVARPLDQLRQDAVALRNRDFSDRPPPSSMISEIAEFGDTFDAMRRHIREHNEASTRFVPREFLEQLHRDDIRSLQLGDHAERNMTVLFSDIRSFTALSESMSPQQTFNFVNSYLTRVGPIIRDHDGFIDKYIGDAIMGLFPVRPRDAVDAAIAMQQRVVTYNEERARAGYAPIQIGIGLHYGSLMLGTIGETLRFETTVIADAVNVAARLESLTKTFGSLILASGQVLAQIDAPPYQTRLLSEIQVKGTTRSLTVYEVCDADPPLVLAHKVRTAAAFNEARLAYAAGDFVHAHRLFTEVLADDSDDRAAAYFHERAAEMKGAGREHAWTGVEKMETK